MEDALFVDRADAARQLIQKIPPVDARRAILLGIPRGGVPMTVILAEALHLPFDLLLVRKLTVSSDPEYAIGAVSLTDARVAEKGALPPKSIEQRIEEARHVLQHRNALYRQQRPFPDLREKTVILVDDGMATGRTLLHAVEVVRLQKPQAIWVAVPVCSREAASRLGSRVDRLICLHQPEPFVGVGRFYRFFPSVSDEEVVQSLRTGKFYN